MPSEAERLRNIKRHLERYHSDPQFRQKQIDAAKARYKANAEEICKQQRAKHKTMKREALRRYGDACHCCGERNYQFLTFHHSLKDGAAHHRSLGLKSGKGLVRALWKLGWPDVPGLVTLCANCHMAIDLWGGCPHKK
jgi:hypothetical protein